jgi:hypothetical protein
MLASLTGMKKAMAEPVRYRNKMSEVPIASMPILLFFTDASILTSNFNVKDAKCQVSLAVKKTKHRKYHSEKTTFELSFSIGQRPTMSLSSWQTFKTFFPECN